VRDTDVPRRFRFRHPLVRRAVYEAAPGGWRLGAHERTAEALAARGAPAVERAHHVESSARRGDLAAVAVLREAGEAAAGRTPATAARLFAGALRLLPATAPADERAALLDALAGAQVAVGRLREPRAAMLESLDLRRAAPPGMRVRLIAAVASIENLLGLHKEAHARLTTALEELPDPSSPEAAALLFELAIDGFYRLDFDSMQDCAQHSIDVAAPLDQRSLHATGLALHALAAVFAGNVQAAEASCTDAAGLIDVMSDDELARSRLAVNNLATAEVYLDRLHEAEAHAERALAVAYATGQEQFLPILFWTGFIRTARGRLAEAAEILDTAVEIARVSNHAQGLAWNLGGRSLAATAAGDVEAALRAGDEATEVLGELEPSFPAAWAAVALATALEPAGDPGRAAEVLLEAAGGDDLPRIPAIWRPAGFELMTRCRLALGEPDEAQRAADSAAACARELDLPLPAALADRAHAMVALDGGDPLAAVEPALASATTAGNSGAALEAAVSRMLAGRALAAAGEKKRAAAELEGAAADFDACAASGRRQAAERELGKLGRRVHRRTRPGKADGTGVESLTERELEVARLVVDRKTNAQIASELFLSPKTVETHIRHLFRKLDVSSRVEVARVVERADRQVGAR
ncbi:MAG: LuxR C-terminal-related transcriptional regulator, partial [Candidatus Rokuibacteriota bacterium]